MLPIWWMLHDQIRATSQTSYPLVTCMGSLSPHISSFHSSYSLISTFYPHACSVGSVFRDHMSARERQKSPKIEVLYRATRVGTAYWRRHKGVILDALTRLLGRPLLKIDLPLCQTGRMPSPRVVFFAPFDRARSIARLIR